jgi:hypothetical protein
MLERAELKELAERRRLLVLEAELHRGLITAECESLRARLEAVRERTTAARPWLMAGGAIAGVLAFRRWRWIVRWVPAGLIVLRWLRTMKGR